MRGSLRPSRSRRQRHDDEDVRRHRAPVIAAPVVGSGGYASATPVVAPGEEHSTPAAGPASEVVATFPPATTSPSPVHPRRRGAEARRREGGPGEPARRGHDEHGARGRSGGARAADDERRALVGRGDRGAPRDVRPRAGAGRGRGVGGRGRRREVVPDRAAGVDREYLEVPRRRLREDGRLRGER